VVVQEFDGEAGVLAEYEVDGVVEQ